MQLKNLNPTQFERLSTLLDQALDLASEQREGWLNELEGRDPEAGALLRELLVACSAANADNLLETRELLDRHLAAAAQAQPSLIGKQFGPYRILQQLGQGGMGSVWLAERADGLFARQVALKLVHPSLTGSALTERFARERAILAALNHPRIARLLDAGFAEDGQPYLALDYVEGTPLTTYCDAQRLPLSARIELIVQVLSAVQHAHRNLVIHRDLKPSNILVTAAGQVCLLDFGIAKLISEGEAKETELTQLGGRALTPDYASPEQIAGQPITTASDVYSLGVVLYELLGGARPYKLKRDSRGALEEAILGVDPVKPSQATLGDEIAQARATTVNKLRQALSGDLDTIALKALKKNPAERYATADAFMQDLQRYLANEPVLARPDSAAYRFNKFVSRNRFAVAATLLIGVALATATAISFRQAQVARHEAHRAEVAQNFLLDIFRANSDRQKDPLKARQTTAREMLDIGAERVMSELKSEPESQALLLKTLADMYYQLGLGDDAAKLESSRIQVLKRIHGARDVKVASALVDYASTLHSTSRRGEILPALDEAKAILDAKGDLASPLRGQLFTYYAQRYQNVSYQKMRDAADEALRVLRNHSSATEDSLSTVLTLAARARFFTGDYLAAQPLYLEALAELDKAQPSSVVATVQILQYLAENQASLQDFGEAERSYRRALDLASTRLGAKDVSSIHSETRLARFLHTTGRRQEARQRHVRALHDVLAQRGESDTLFTPGARMEYGRSLLAEGRLQEAEPLISLALASNRVHYRGSAILASGLRTQASTYVLLGRYEQAGQLFREAAEIWGQGVGTTIHPSRNNRAALDEAQLDLALGGDAIAKLQTVAPPMHAERVVLRSDELERDIGLAQAYLQLARIAEARSLTQAALDRVQQSTLREYYQPLEAAAALRLGQAQLREDNARAARPNLERALALRVLVDDAKSPSIAEVQIALAECLLAQGEGAQAKALIGKARLIHAANPELGEHLKAPLRRVEDTLARMGHPKA